MKAARLLTMATLIVALLMQACGPVAPPPPTGSMDGLVSIESEGVDGISVTLSNGASATTANGGKYLFGVVEAGAYTVAISNYPADAMFDRTWTGVTFATEGETVTANFSGTWIRTSSIIGSVTVENESLGGVTVKISGMGNSETLTDGSGLYVFNWLRAGTYTVEISGFDEDLYGFDVTTERVTVALQDTAWVPFTGIMLRTAGIEGTVTVEGTGIPNVTVTVTGGPKDEEHTRLTDSAGYYIVDRLHAGDYAVAISNFASDMDFDTTTQSIPVELRDTATANFVGTWIRTTRIEGTVTEELWAPP